jgi:AAA domain
MTTFTNGQKVVCEEVRDYVNLDKNAVVLISGGPGTGKTYIIEKLRKYLNLTKHKNINIITLAFTNRVASRISGKTFNSYFKMKYGNNSDYFKINKTMYDFIIDENKNNLTHLHNKNFFNRVTDESKKYSLINVPPPLSNQYNIIMIDESSTVPLWFSFLLINFFKQCPKFIIIFFGDQYQTKPVGFPMSIFDCNFYDLMEFLPKVELFKHEISENKRFDPEYNTIIQHFLQIKNEHAMKLATRQLSPDDMDVDEPDVIDDIFKFLKKYFIIHRGIITPSALENVDRVIAFANYRVNLYNQIYLETLPGEQIKIRARICGTNTEIDEKFERVLELESKKNLNCSLALKRGALVSLTEKEDDHLKGSLYIFEQLNGCGNINLRNIRTGAIISVGRKKFITIRNSSLYKQYVGLEVDRDELKLEQFPITLAYATTVHKIQGDTIDGNIIIDFQDNNSHITPEIIYTAISRVKKLNQIKFISMSF